MNPSPFIEKVSEPRIELEWENNRLKEISEDTIYEILRDIRDPEHPNTLEELGVVKKENIHIFVDHLENEIENDSESDRFLSVKLLSVGSPIKNIHVSFIPTIPHCSMASFIGLCILKQLYKYVPKQYHIRVSVPPDAHVQSKEINKQFSDKDRVYAAFENDNITETMEGILSSFQTV